MPSDEVSRLHGIRLGGAADAIHRIRHRLSTRWGVGEAGEPTMDDLWDLLDQVAEELGINSPYSNPRHDHH